MEQPQSEVLGVTIDSSETMDIDDGIWVDRTVERGYRVVVAIAGVGHTIKAGASLDVLARANVATRYRPWGNTPMLPLRLSEDRLALLPGRRRRALVVEVILGPDFTATWPPSVRMAPFRSMAKLSYGRVAEVLAAPPGEEDGKTGRFRAMLEEARVLALGLLQRRRAAGALAIYDLSQGWVATEEGFLKKLEKVDATIGYVIIQELMILANEAFARFAAERDIPILYRNHTARACAPNRLELAELVTHGLTSPVVNLQQVLQQLAVVLDVATYAPVVRGHYGLSLPIYAHLTSPIRRYADLISQRQLAAYMLGQPLPHAAEELQAVADHLNQHAAEERAADRDKYKASADARGRIAAGSADAVAALDAAGLERAIRVCIRERGDAPTPLAAGVRRQIEAGTVPLVCKALLLLDAPSAPGWGGLRTAVLATLGAKPEEAKSVLAMAQQMGWSVPRVIESGSSGPPHAPTFRATVEVLAPGERRARGSAEAPRAAVAEQRAAVVLLARHLGLDVPAFTEPVPAAAPAKQKKTAVPLLEWRDVETKESIALLQEYCQKRGLPLPVYEFDTRGPTHAPTVTCTAKAVGMTRQGRGGKKQDAKRAAALAVLEGILAAQRTRKEGAGTTSAP